MSNDLFFLHYQPIEQYPPIMNFLLCISDANKIDLITTSSRKFKKKFFKTNLIVIRFSNFWGGRYLQMLFFNLVSIALLIFRKPQKVVVYETISMFPAYIYSLFSDKFSLYLHFHEYTSLEEYNRVSRYIKFLYRIEKRLYHRAVWISHTNWDRTQLFLNDNPGLDPSKLHALPNYPLAEWKRPASLFPKQMEQPRPINFVYVGALSLTTMYTQQFAEWVVTQNGAVTWTIYTNNFSPDALEFLTNLNCPWIRFAGAVDYFDLPKELSKFDVGLAYYNGHILNYIYNVPNKVFEYLACGLEVWYSSDLLSTEAFAAENNLPCLKKVDFNQLHPPTMPVLVTPCGLPGQFSAEYVYAPLIHDLLK